VSGFAADWLALRAPYDSLARDAALEARLAAWLPADRPLRIVDLGAGTGSNPRHLAPRLGRPQHWTLIEHDPRLIAAGARALSLPGLSFAYRRGDLAGELETLVPAQIDLVTAAALIDLTSAAWLDRLAALVRARRCALLVVLSYDGRIELAPPHRDDATIIAAVNRHQTGDKGFGAALGPAAHGHLRDRLAAAEGRSDWRLGPADGALQAALIAGWAEAAASLGVAAERWLAARAELIAAGAASARVGHHDLLWLPG
jgi:SAM-dependent methyltransferase